MLPRVTDQVLHQLIQEYSSNSSASDAALIFNRLKKENPEFLRLVKFLTSVVPEDLGQRGDDLVLNSTMLAYRALELAEIYRDANALASENTVDDPIKRGDPSRVETARTLAKAFLERLKKTFGR